MWPTAGLASALVRLVLVLTCVCGGGEGGGGEGGGGEGGGGEGDGPQNPKTPTSEIKNK